jgi:hypothetical protein
MNDCHLPTALIYTHSTALLPGFVKVPSSRIHISRVIPLRSSAIFLGNLSLECKALKVLIGLLIANIGAFTIIGICINISHFTIPILGDQFALGKFF